jgi:hypothetical protein
MQKDLFFLVILEYNSPMKNEQLLSFAKSLIGKPLAYAPEGKDEARFFRIDSIEKVGVNKKNGREFLTAHVQDLDDYKNKVRTLSIENIMNA